ncbi:MAG: sugar ABC transporter permease [Candidatus Dormibacteraeota bacterium]|nr:sugar ABC transporter permease [Candidatus Dormibacteraeota bacterium]
MILQAERDSRRRLTPRQRRALRTGLLFISPWVFGFLAFQLYPILYALYLSFTQYTGFGPAEWVGLDNYVRMFTQDPLFWQSLFNTVYYTVLAVPIGVVMALIMALAMNQKLREVSVYRAALYLPSVLPLFAISFIFLALLNPQFGLVNYVLSLLRIPSIDWLGDPRWSKLAIVLMAQLGAGNAAIVLLAGLRAIPTTLYEAAVIDGANWWTRFWRITIPLLTPVILYDVILGLHAGLQVFTQAYILTNGGPSNSTLFFVFYLYNNAFSYSQMGYASALSWVLFIISFAIAILVFRLSSRWVNYELVA